MVEEKNETMELAEREVGANPTSSLHRDASLGTRRAMFIGAYRYAIDDKGRLTLPTSMRLHLGDGGAMSPMNERLTIWPRPSFETAVAEVWAAADRGDLPVDEAKKFNNLAAEVVPDAQGRIVIPNGLRLDCGLERDVIVLGSGPRVEIVPADDFENERLHSLDVAVPNLLDRLGL